MEDTAKVSAKLTALQQETGYSWLATVNTTHLKDFSRNITTDVKVFIAPSTGFVRELPIADFQTAAVVEADSKIVK